MDDKPFKVCINITENIGINSVLSKIIFNNINEKFCLFSVVRLIPYCYMYINKANLQDILSPELYKDKQLDQRIFLYAGPCFRDNNIHLSGFHTSFYRKSSHRLFGMFLVYSDISRHHPVKNKNLK